MLLSVVLVTWNRKDYLEIAVASILSQIGVELELLLIDNGSEDGTEDYARSLAATDQRVKYFRFDRNVGIPAAMNHGLATGRGEMFFCFDDDQELEDSAFFQKALAIEQRYPWDLLSTQITNMDGTEEPFLSQPAMGTKNFYVGNFLNGSVFIKKKVLESIGLFEADYFRQAQENEYAIRVILHGFNILYSRELQVKHLRGLNRPANKIVMYYAYRNTLLKNYKYFSGWKLLFLNVWQFIQSFMRLLCGRMTPRLMCKALTEYIQMKPRVIRILDYDDADMERFFFVSRKVAQSPEQIGSLGFWSYCFLGLQRFSNPR